MRSAGYYWKSEELDWAKKEVLNIIKECPQRESWEEHIYKEMIERTDIKWWRRLNRGLRGLITSMSIEHLVNDNTINAVPGKTQTTGRRCLTYTNPLVRVAEAL